MLITAFFPPATFLIFGGNFECVRICSVFLIHLVESFFSFGQFLPYAFQTDFLQVFQTHFFVTKKKTGATLCLDTEGMEGLRSVYFTLIIIEAEVANTVHFRLYFHAVENELLCPLVRTVRIICQDTDDRIFCCCAMYFFHTGCRSNCIVWQAEAET